MENGLLFEIIKDIIAGVLTALVLLPINTEAIQEKLFGKRKRVLKTAKAELLDVVKNMVFSGQRVADTVFEKIRTSIANKHRIKVEELGSKDDVITILLEYVNSADVLDGNKKKYYSERLQREYSGIESNEDKYSNNKDKYDEIPINNREAVRVMNRVDEKFESENMWSNVRSDRNAWLMSSVFSIVGGLCVFTIMHAIDGNAIFSLIVSLLIFVVCVSILLSIIDGKINKDLEFFRKLCYKVILLMLLAMISVVVAV